MSQKAVQHGRKKMGRCNAFLPNGLYQQWIFVSGITIRFNRFGAIRIERLNTYVPNLWIVALAALLFSPHGWLNFPLVHATILMLTVSLGIRLFYFQLTF
ncbi:hypothetical protein I9X38_18560 [Bacillus mojavensis]|nr:hypothetical protein I9X38_18560 [Bacillus mojavensis]